MYIASLLMRCVVEFFLTECKIGASFEKKQGRVSSASLDSSPCTSSNTPHTYALVTTSYCPLYFYAPTLRYTEKFRQCQLVRSTSCEDTESRTTRRQTGLSACFVLTRLEDMHPQDKGRDAVWNKETAFALISQNPTWRCRRAHAAVQTLLFLLCS